LVTLRRAHRGVCQSVLIFGVPFLVDGVLPTAQGTVESVMRSYQVGRAEFLTLLSVEDAHYRAQLEAAAVAADYLTQLVMLRQLTTGEQP